MSTPRKLRSGRFGRVRSIAVVTVLIAAGLMWISAAQAVHANGMFELDGNTTHDSATTPPYDWNSLFDANGSRLITPDPVNGPLLADSFVTDTAEPDQSYFTSNKDIQPIASGQQHWGCSPINNPLDKDNLLHAYAALVQVPANAPENAGDQVLYLASERGSNNGTSFAGFWLLKDPTVGCSGSNNFSGHHTDGDLLIISDYTNGGGTQDVSVYRWTGDDATGGPVLDATFNGSLCTSAPANDNACAIANSSTITTPWSPTSHLSNTFVEAGIDLTALLGPNGGCFTNFLAETRSSNQLTATLKDFASGQFSTCVPPTIDTTATPGGASNPTGVANQHDVATVSAVSGRPDPTGTISFFLCNPSQVTAGGCVSGGTQVGGAVTIVAGSATSDNADASLITAAGKYCWRAEYTPDAAGSNFYAAGSETNATTECFSVQASPAISTTPSETSGSVGDVLNDSASLTGGSNYDGSGTITFNLYGPADPTCQGTPAYTQTVKADHNGSDYATTNATVTADTAGTWNWTADFSGDSNNNPAHSGCGQESVTINPADIHIVKTADKPQVNAGEQIGFTLTVYNDGLGDARGVQLSDTLPTNPGLGWTIESSGAGWGNPSSCAIAAGVLTCGPATVPAGTTQAASTFTVHIVSGTDKTTGGVCPGGSGVVTNTGTVTTTNDGRDQSTAATCVAAPSIHIVKTADKSKVQAGDPIGFTLTVFNAGSGDAHGVTLSDTLPTNPGLAWSIDSQGAGWAHSCAISSGVLSCGPVTVPAGTTQTASTFTVHIASQTTGATGGDCPQTGVVSNTGHVTTSNDGSDQSSASVCVQAVVDLSITKSGSPARQEGLGDITWTMVVTNNGPSDDTGVTISDPMPAGNTFVSAQTTKGTCTGGATLDCTIGPMAAGEQVTITLVTMPSAVGTQTNTVVVMGDRPETNLANNTATASVVVVAPHVLPACVAVSRITPGHLIVGRKTLVTVYLTQKRKPVKGVRVRIKGPKVNLRTKPSDRKGVVKLTLTMHRKGILTFTPISSVKGQSCGNRRIGVRGIFTPPVTG
jgi:uncharacterized repeat protein (TIGR01451 family)